ncbi:MAG: ATP-dependent DNA helicase, partial [Gammaproteobacteria bacterium]
HVTSAAQPDQIQWYEVHRRSVSFQMTPLDIAPAFVEHKSRKGGTWIFTSATLTVGKRFDHFSERLGLLQTVSQQFDSPFDYARQALMYLPKGLPEPNSPGYTDAVVDIAKPVLQASAGRAFILFTSHRALRQAETALRQQIDYPLLVQGEAPRDQLLETFRRTPHAVLLGTSSFWEGVDVRGEALSCVIIDKLPFAAPNDPVLQARLEKLREQGKNPFMQYQLPAAVITLKQGVGRLIRDTADRGVLVLCDPRLRSKAYGRTFLQSLPQMPISDSLDTVRQFFQPATEAMGAEL